MQNTVIQDHSPASENGTVAETSHLRDIPATHPKNQQKVHTKSPGNSDSPKGLRDEPADSGCSGLVCASPTDTLGLSEEDSSSSPANCISPCLSHHQQYGTRDREYLPPQYFVMTHRVARCHLGLLDTHYAVFERSRRRRAVI